MQNITPVPEKKSEKHKIDWRPILMIGILVCALLAVLLTSTYTD